MVFSAAWNEVGGGGGALFLAAAFAHSWTQPVAVASFFVFIIKWYFIYFAATVIPAELFHVHTWVMVLTVALTGMFYAMLMGNRRVFHVDPLLAGKDSFIEALLLILIFVFGFLGQLGLEHTFTVNSPCLNLFKRAPAFATDDQTLTVGWVLVVIGVTGLVATMWVLLFARDPRNSEKPLAKRGRLMVKYLVLLIVKQAALPWVYLWMIVLSQLCEVPPTVIDRASVKFIFWVALTVYYLLAWLYIEFVGVEIDHVFGRVRVASDVQAKLLGGDVEVVSDTIVKQDRANRAWNIRIFVVGAYVYELSAAVVLGIVEDSSSDGCFAEDCLTVPNFNETMYAWVQGILLIWLMIFAVWSLWRKYYGKGVLFKPVGGKEMEMVEEHPERDVRKSPPPPPPPSIFAELEVS